MGDRRRGWDPRTWAGLSPNGIGQQKPNHYLDMAKVAWKQKGKPVKTWRILSRGVCDGCALGVAGFHDWTIPGVHLCMTRLNLLPLNTADALDPALLADVGALRRRTTKELRELGRLGHPVRRRHGEPGFTPIPWDEALDAVAGGLRAADPDRVHLYVTSRGITNETYYVAGKAARALGIASVDSAARVCHAPSTVALKEAIGIGATTCSFADVIETELVVLFGSNPAANQPVFMKYLYEAKRRGARVVVVNPVLEPGLERYWVPSSPESALFGTRVCDLHVPVRQGGDVALCLATLKLLVQDGRVDEAFLQRECEGWAAVRADLDAQPMAELLRLAGLTLEQVRAFADLYGSVDRAVLVWSMGITQHRGAVEGVQAIVALGLARAMVERDGCGLMPIRGHSGVQGGAEVGCYATALPGGADVTPEHAAELAARWGFPVPTAPGMTAPEAIDAAGRGELDVLWASGGSFTEVLPDPPAVEAALGRVPLRVHQDVVVTPQMWIDPPPGGQVVLLPVRTRYEQEGGGTETTTERRIAFSPEVPGLVPAEARTEWRVFADVVARVRPDLADRFAWRDGQALRAELAEVVPLYDGVQHLRTTGDSVQWGGRHAPLHRPLVLVPVRPPADDCPPDRWRATTRRGKQFNSMVWADADPLTGWTREDVVMDADEARAAGLAAGDRVVVRGEAGSLEGRLRLARVSARTLLVHWPEGNVLLPTGPQHREPRSQVPDYTAIVSVEKAPPAA